jgi:hypothetical protein
MAPVAPGRPRLADRRCTIVLCAFAIGAVAAATTYAIGSLFNVSTA